MSRISRQESRQVALRNALQDDICEVADVASHSEKGCILISRQVFDIGDLIFEEVPQLIVSPSTFPANTIKALEAVCREANLHSVLSNSSNDDNCLVSVRTLLPALQFLREDFETQSKAFLMYCPPEAAVPPAFLRVLRHSLALILRRGLVDPAAAAAAGRRHALEAAAALERIALVCQCNIFAVADDASESALCLAAGTASHACLPACNWHFSPAGRFQLRAARRLGPGDELTVSYLQAERSPRPASCSERAREDVCVCARARACVWQRP